MEISDVHQSLTEACQVGFLGGALVGGCNEKYGRDTRVFLVRGRIDDV